MQLQDLLLPIQSGTHRFVKSFVSENTEFVTKYVNAGLAAITFALGPVNTFMRHLLVIQGLDPDSVPGEKQRLLLQEALNNFFSKHHDDAFDSDYDLSWVHKKFEETRDRMKHLGLTKDKFTALTDLSNVEDAPIEELAEINRVAPETPKHEIPLDTKEGRQAYRRRVLEDAAKQLKEDRATLKEFEEVSVFDPIADLRQAVDSIEKELELSPKKGIKTGKRKLNKTTKVRRLTPTVKEKGVHPPKVSSIRSELQKKMETAKKLVDDMITYGLVEDNKEAVQDQLEQLLLMNDEAIESLARVVAKHSKTTRGNFSGSFRRTDK